MKKAIIALAASLSIAAAGCSKQEEPQESMPAPAETTWQSVAGIFAPVESADGPFHDSPVLHGYARTPQGAAVAAINGQIAMATSDDDHWPQVSRMLLAPGEGRDQWAQGRSLVSIAPGTVQQHPATIEGFRVSDYSEDKATVVVAANYPGTGLAAYPVQVEWIADDWKIVVPTQDNAVDMTELDTLDGFVPFAA